MALAGPRYKIYGIADRDTYLLSGLRNKRELIAGRIVELEKEAAQLREDLGHVEAVLRICQPGIKLPRVMPRKLDLSKARML